MDWELMAREIVTAVRGKRSQRALSKRLGFDSNVLYRWETGRSYPAAEDFFRLLGAAGKDSGKCLAQFRPDWVTPSDLGNRDGVTELLELLREGAAINQLATKSEHSRFVVRRWLDGHTAIRLPDFLKFVEVSSLRVLDFVSCLVAPERVPSVAASYRLLEASRKAAFEQPWSHVVLRALELKDYQHLKRHRVGWIARRLGLTVSLEEECVAILLAAGQINWDGTHYRVEQVRTIDTRRARQYSQKIKGFWLDVSRERQQKKIPGLCAYNLCSVSKTDHERIVELYRRFHHDVQQIVAQSEPAEQVVLLTAQIVALDHPREAGSLAIHGQSGAP
jgi:hypothetical protein